MEIFFKLLTIFCFLGIIYLIYLFYRKDQQDTKKCVSIPKDSKLKIKLVRFNPFRDTGGNQSFILTLLDSSNSGVILTSLHSRDTTRIYAKAVKNGETDKNSLSPEEKECLQKTIINS
jgi:hypothetical protein